MLRNDGGKMNIFVHFVTMHNIIYAVNFLRLYLLFILKLP